MSYAVEMTGISKRFGEVQALDAVDLHVESGVIHALVGENGAGKTTLMKALYGALHPDSGSIAIDGHTAPIRNSMQAIAKGVGMVSQHYGIIGDLTCLENLILGAEGGPLLKMNEARKRAEELAQRMGFQFEWDVKAESLSPASAQKLEILKLLWRNSRIMILDEPTAMLSPADGEALFQNLRRLANEGNTVVLVTHRLPEVFAHCSWVTVLRGGRRVADMPVAETTPAELAELIVGKKLAEPFALVRRPAPEILQLKNVSVRGDRGHLALKNVNLTLHFEEIVGIAGVDGSGQRELFDVLTSVRPLEEGAIYFGKINDLARVPLWDRLERGIRTIPEDRHADGVIEEWSLYENAPLGIHRLPPFAKGLLIDEKGRREAAAQIAERFHTRHGGLHQPMSSLSGGNQQRFVNARALFAEPRVVLAYQPARGLDLAATRELYDGFRETSRQLASILVVSYDLDELLEHCDRIVVMNRGELFVPGPGKERDPEEIGRLMVGVA